MGRFKPGVARAILAVLQREPAWECHRGRQSRETLTEHLDPAIPEVYR